MTGWRSLLFLVAALGCAGNHSANTEGANVDLQPDSASVLASSVQVEVGDSDVRLVFHITNTSNRPVELEFGTGQRYDFAVRSADGGEVWRWSRDRMFTQMVGSETIAAGGNLKYEERFPLRGTGVFTAIAQLTSTNYPVEQRATFERRPK